MNSFSTIDEPAEEKYFFWKGKWLSDVKATCREAWLLNLDAFRENNMRVANAWHNARISGGLAWLKVAFFIAQSAAVFLGTFIWTPLLVALFCAVAGLVCATYSTTAFALALAERLFLRINGLFNLCKHCHAKVDLPVYECPNCHARHMNLLPGARYGIFYRKCSTPGCGQKIPVLRITGKNTLPSFCRGCGAALSNDDFVPVTIAFLGGPSVGKTMLFNALATDSLESVIAGHSWKMIVKDEEKDKIKQMKNWVECGITPRTTQDRAIDALCIDADRGEGRFPLRVYMYDPPGESFKNTANLRIHRYYDNLKGVVWVVDPFTLDDVRRRLCGRETEFESAKVGALPPEECLERWLIGMEKDFSGVVKDSVCAVVITKTDVPCLSETTGLRMGDDDAACRKFLSACECDSLVNTIDRTFTKVRFFAVSATGGEPEGQKFSPVGLDAATKWIFDNLVR